MGANEFDVCVKNGVADIVEVQIGLEALVLVTRKQDPDIPVTFDNLYRAIAAELPSGDDFLPNISQTWRDISPSLPKSDIHVIIPSRATVSRQFFDNHFLQGACREIFDYKKIYSAEERVAQCIGLRRDGRVIEVGLPYTSTSIVEAVERAPRGTIALLSLRYAAEAADKLKILPLEGVMPNRDTVGHLNYPATRSLYYYVKRSHIKDYEGQGPVLGLREFITEVTRDSAIGDKGYLVPLGLVPLSQDMRDAARKSALALTRMKR
jgi:phosphate transport system substrate-binding protein